VGRVSDDMVQEALFPIPAVEWLPAPDDTRRWTGPRPARWERYSTRRRELCGDCVKLIHERGQDKAPLPKVARWKRGRGKKVEILCEQHKDARQARESGAE
jgi:hypothetical protein